MAEFGSWRGREGFHHHHHHHFIPPWALDQGDFGPPAPVAPMADMDDFGCDPSTPGFRVFGQDDDDQSAPQDDDQGGQGGVLDAVAQVAQGIPDVILPSAAATPYPGYAVAPVPYYRHRRRHYHVPEVLYIDPRFDPHDRRWDAYAWGRLSRFDQDRYRRLWTERARHFHGEEDLLHQASKGTFGQWPAQNFAQVPQSPNFRYGPGGYRPRGGHHHHHHHPGMGPQGYPGGGYPGGPQGYPGGGMAQPWQGVTPGTPPMPTGAPGMQFGLPPGSYQQTCNTCNYDGQTLRCTCKDMSGNWQHTSLVTDPTGAGQGISNHNGQLVIGAF
jgi:hypothetical protein